MVQDNEIKRFCGKQEILILVDSGSVATFISDTIAAPLQFTRHPCEKVQYTTANWSILDSGTHIPQFSVEHPRIFI
jgi:hypothetical protein